MILIPKNGKLWGINKILYEALLTQKKDTQLLIILKIDSEEQTRINIYKENTVKFKQEYMIIISPDKDYRIIDISQFDDIEILTMEGCF